jgi:serine/threonine protein kinase
MVTLTGTPAYRAPEVSNLWGYSSKVDICGLGMTTYAMIAGEITGAYVNAAFSNVQLHLATKLELLHHISPDLSGPRWENTSLHCRAFVLSSHQILSALRPSAARLLKHPWFVESVTPTTKKNRLKAMRKTSTTISVDEPAGELTDSDSDMEHPKLVKSRSSLYSQTTR